MQNISLTQGQMVIIDDEDFDLISQYKWYAKKMTGKFYAATNMVIDGKRTTILMHRFLIGAPDGIEVDHKNLNGLDNRKENLRLASCSNNRANTLKCWGDSKYKGVSPSGNNWRARIQVENKSIYLGSFNDEIKAAEAYDTAALKYFEEFAKLNFVGNKSKGESDFSTFPSPFLFKKKNK